MPAMLTARFRDALVYAHRLHARQRRKGSGIPYISHLLGVCSLVLEYGGDEDEAIAALLHDAVEDQGGAPILVEIRRRFGEKVAAIVSGCSDSDTIPKPPWRERKERYIAHLPEAAPEVRLVSMADKLHNARAVLMDYRLQGEELWGNFKGGREGTLWYYRAVLDAYRSVDDSSLLAELERAVVEMELMTADHYNPASE
jgi:(p)ppGpp synthase/HD superfamily hydrolase